MIGEGDKNNDIRQTFKRKLTPFLCKEMLYEYASGLLDDQRKADMDAYLPSDRAAQESLDDVKRGLEYCDILSRAEVADEILARVDGAETITSLILRYTDWDEWPETLRWSTSALAVSILVAGIVTAVPWKKLPIIGEKRTDNSVVLADIPQEGSTKIADGEASPHSDEEDSEMPPGDEGMGTSGDEHDDGSEARTVVAREEDADGTHVEPKAVASGAAVAAAKPVDQPKTAAPSENAGEEPEAKTNKDEKPRGFVYRAFMNLANLDSITPEIVEKIGTLGGTKAGEVELGWRRESSGAEPGSYFHFTMPSANEEKLMEMLRAYGPVRISKDPHPRVMPPGQIRFILWVEPLAAPPE